MPIEEKDIK